MTRRRTARLGWIAVALSIWSGFIQAAEPTCYEWKLGVTNGTFTSWPWTTSAGVIAQAITFCQNGSSTSYNGACVNLATSKESWGCSFSFSAPVSDGTGGFKVDGSTSCTHSNGVSHDSATPSFGVQRQEIECPADPCSTAVELAQPGVAVGANVAQSGQMCSADDGSGGSYSGGLNETGCEVVRDGAGISSSDGAHWYGQVKYTGVSCPASPTPQALDSKSNCIVAGGGQMCVSKQKKNCGTVNGQAVCLDSVPSGSCLLLSGGGAVCTAAAETAPKDVMGDPIEPDFEFESTSEANSSDPGTTTTYNYYSQSTVNSSSTPVTGEGGGGSGGDGSSEGGGDGCTEENCAGELPDDFEELESFQSITQGFLDRVGDAGVVASVSSVGEAMPTGACPNWTMEVFGREISLSAPMCTIYDSISGILSAVMLVAWGLLASRIVLSA